MAVGGGFLPPVIVTLLADTKQFTDSLAKASGEMEAFGAKTATSAAKGQQAWENLGKYATGAAVLIGVESVKMASEFQASMEKLNTQAGVPQEQIKGLSNSVLDLSGKVGFGPDSLAQALFHVESTFQSTGKSGADMMQILKVGAEGARIGGSNLVDTQNALDSAIVSGIPGAENLNAAMGLLNATVGVGDMTMQDLADALGSGVMPVVKNYGLTLTDVGAALADFGDNNIRGAKAGTALRMSVQALAVPLASGATALQKIGLNSKSLALDMEHGGLLQALEDLRTHMDAAGVTGVQTGEMLTEIFGKRAGTGVAVLMNSLDLLKSKYPELTKSANNFADAWTQTQGTFKQQMADWTANLEHAAITIGTVLIPKIEALGGFIADNSGAFKVLAEIVGGVLTLAMANYVRVKALAFGQSAIDVVTWMATKLGLLTAATEAATVATTQYATAASAAAAANGFAVTQTGALGGAAAATSTKFNLLTAAADILTPVIGIKLGEAVSKSIGLHGQLGTALNDLSHHLPIVGGFLANYDAAHSKAAKSVADHANATSNLITESAKLLPTSQANQQAVQDLTAVLNTMDDTMADLTAKGIALSAALHQLADVHISATEAAINWEKSLETARTTLADTGATLDITTSKGRDATGALLDLIKSTEGQTKAMEDEGKSAADVKAAYDDHVQALRNVMTQAGFTKDQIDQLLAQYNLLADAPNIDKTITTHHDDVYTAQQSAASAAANGPANAGDAAGGIIGRALAAGDQLTMAAAGYTAGFMTSGPTLVGEGNPMWPEFVVATDPQYHSRNVDLWMKAGKSLGMFGGGSGSSSGPGGISPVGGVTITGNITVVVQGATGAEAARDFQAQLLRYQRANGGTGIKV